MRSISERDLAVVIPLLAAKIRELKKDLETGAAEADNLSEEEVEARCDKQELLGSFEATLRHLREEYEGALEEGFVLPDYERLVAG